MTDKRLFDDYTGEVLVPGGKVEYKDGYLIKACPCGKCGENKPNESEVCVGCDNRIYWEEQEW